MSQFVQTLENRQFLSVSMASDAMPVSSATDGVVMSAGVKAASSVTLTGKTYSGTIANDGINFTYTLTVTTVDSKGKITAGTLTVANTALGISKALSIGTSANSAASGTLTTKGVFAIKVNKGQTATAGTGNGITLDVSGTFSGKANLAATTPDANVSVVSTISFASAKSALKLSAAGKATLPKTA
jgi:hypothetical protein